MATIHPSAIVDAKAELAATVQVGPFCHIGPDVVLDDGVTLHSHAVVTGRTRIGRETVIFPFASIGHRPQDMKYNGEPSTLEIGARNTIREYVTMNPGTTGGGMVTRIGDGNLFMCSAHIGHDCQIGDGCILVNNATLGGHVIVSDFAIIGGNSAVHQFVRIGKHAMVGGMTGVGYDVIPYGSVIGNRGILKGLNVVGLKRRGFSHDEIHAAHAAFKAIFKSGEGTLAGRVAMVAETYADKETVQEIVRFLSEKSYRGITTRLSDDEED